MSNPISSEKNHENVVTGMLAAVSFVAVLLGRLVPAVQGFLSYDPKDAIVVIAGFIYGPSTSVIISVVVSIIEMFVGSATGLYGCIMNIVSTCSFAIPATICYKKMHSMKGACLGLVFGMMGMTTMMCLWNYIITPFYMGMPRNTVAAMIPTLFLPFNLIKSGINAGLTLVLYKPLVTALRKARLIPCHETSRGHFHIGFTLISVLVLITFVLLFLVFTGVL